MKFGRKTLYKMWSPHPYDSRNQKPQLVTVKRPCDRHNLHQGTLQSGRRCGDQKKNWMMNVKERTGHPMQELLTTTQIYFF